MCNLVKLQGICMLNKRQNLIQLLIFLYQKQAVGKSGEYRGDTGMCDVFQGTDFSAGADNFLIQIMQGSMIILNGGCR